MASWFDRGRPAVFEALQQVCDRIDADLAAELQSRDVEQHAFLTKEVERLKARVTAVDQLEQENRALRDEVTNLRSQINLASSVMDKPPASAPATAPAPAPLTARQPLGEISTNTPGRLAPYKVDPGRLNAGTVSVSKYTELQEEYAKLANTCERLKRVKDATNAAARKQQEEKENWIKYAKKLEAKLERHKKDDRERGCQPRSSTEPTRPCPDAKLSTAEAGQSYARPVSTPMATLGSRNLAQPSGTASFSGFEKARRTELSPRRAMSHPLDDRPIEPGQHADSTQGDEEDAAGASLPQLPANNDDPAVLIKAEPSSDLPVVVSERRVGKRKRVDDVINHTTPRRFKTEGLSSDPLVVGESHHFSPQESLDLDTDGSMPTPRKTRILQAQARFEVNCPSNDEVAVRSEIFDIRSRHGKAGASDPPRVSVRDMHMYAAPANETLSEPSGRHRKVSDGVIQLNRSVASLAEDGYDPTRSGRHAATGDRSGEAPSRLSTLLNASKPPPQDQTPLLRPNRGLREASRSTSWLTETPVRVLPFGKGDGKEGGKEGEAPATLRSTAGGALNSALVRTKAVPLVGTPTPATTPASKSKATLKRLRDQPLAHLSLESFRINPRFNNGQNFAFTEVVRSKDERAEIPGCVDPNCCGKYFRAMAQSELEAAGPALIHRQADIALLEEYLGDQVYKLGSMTRQEKEELWLEAKTRELANRHGKHRHRFTRRQSPPGFWNADFPSTQENQRDREEGEKREKRMIEERYREAMREGGRWLFRDE